MTRNDTFFKILFAIEIALLPLIMASYIFVEGSNNEWTVGLFVAGILAVKIWIELFKNKDSKMHLIINAIGSILTVSTLVIFFTVKGYIDSVVLCVFVVILAVIMNLMKIALNGKNIPEMINAVDSCYMLFECLMLIGMTFVVVNSLVTNIALFALILTSVVSIAYKVYYILKFEGGIDKIKSLFRRR